ncbi:hypothetical protein Fmac_001913 [Flemingia macrophylla]|uniref:Uncharacterized protein n=1 Tax=Flemingia macrophylla TaxID=520843 RepID=A0ABD1NK49_9FABA
MQNLEDGEVELCAEDETHALKGKISFKLSNSDVCRTKSEAMRDAATDTASE